MLPDLHRHVDPREDPATLPRPGLVRHSHRLREIAIAKMVQGSAIARINRAMGTRTLPSGFDMYNPGDQVEYIRQSTPVT